MRFKVSVIFMAMLVIWGVIADANAKEKRVLTADDITAFKTVSRPQISPDGQLVAYLVKEANVEKNKNLTSLWWAKWDGSGETRLTHGPKSVSSPQWSPDGQTLAFVSSRKGKYKGSQIWALNRDGGEARQITNIQAEIDSYTWSPDGKRLAVVLRLPEEKSDTPQPMVMDRYVFKGDDYGYYHHKNQWQVHIYDLKEGTHYDLTESDAFEEYSPAWSPDGKHIAFVSYRSHENIEYDNSDIWLAPVKKSAKPRRLTRYKGEDKAPIFWSPDGTSIVYAQDQDIGHTMYGPQKLVLKNIKTGEVSYLAPDLDLDMAGAQFSENGAVIDYIVRDNMFYYLARSSVTGGVVSKRFEADGVIRRFSSGGGHTALLYGTTQKLNEIYALENGKLRQLSHQNDNLHTKFKTSEVRDISFTAKDGTLIHGLLTTPPNYKKGKKYPTILWIHGGPYEQDKHTFDTERQIFAAAGYVVVQVNYRGSAGKGKAFATSIHADWGNKDMRDVISGLDYAIALGVADPKKLGVGGWSQGGLITNFVIVEDQRIKAAIAGAGTGNQIAMYGADWYANVYDNEFGAPWKNKDLWIRMSRPLFEADKIKTPTLYIVGEDDFNVPVIGSEQMYQALRSQNIPTQLVIYPGESHSISSPVFKRDRMKRYLDWYDTYLK